MSNNFDHVGQLESLFSLLPKEAQQSLTDMGERVSHYIATNGESAWQSLDKAILPNLSKINFSQLANCLPPAKTYHRIICSVADDLICLILFIFQVESSDDAAILLHFYGDALPNYKFFSEDNIINKPPQDNDIITKQTPPHNHKTHCYSCVAWKQGEVELTEENYKLRDDGMLELIQQNPRPRHSCVYDDSKDKSIHQISVHFKAHCT